MKLRRYAFWRRTFGLRVVLFFYLIAELMLWATRSAPNGFQIFLCIEQGLLMWAAYILGSLRISDHHPLRKEDYCERLAFTPWRPGLPLPEGPIQPTFWDLARVALFTALCVRRPELRPDLIPCAYILGYRAHVSGVFGVAPDAIAAPWMVLASVLAGFAVLSVWIPGAALALCAIILPIAWVLAPKSLENFPWKETAGRAPPIPPVPAEEPIPISPCARFYSDTRPALQTIHPMSAVLGAFFFALWTYVLISLVPARHAGKAVAAAAAVTVILIFFIVASSPKGLARPLGLLGRIVAGVFWIPGRDRVHSEGAFILIAAATIPFALFRLGASAAFSAAFGALFPMIAAVRIRPPAEDRPYILPGHLRWAKLSFWQEFPVHPNTGRGVDAEPDDDAPTLWEAQRAARAKRRPAWRTSRSAS